MKKPLHILFLGITLLLPLHANEPIKNRPKTCLVLSGGGARGAAHIGVIKMLEQYRIPIDCIAGTSMGALVGGAYASGSSVEDMEKLLASLSTETLFQDSPPRAELNIRRKQEDYTLLTSPEVGSASITGAKLPRGIVSGVQLETVLRKISMPGYHDFDKLPIPYRAVATDLTTGKAEIFKKGELANVMRASMSVPVAIAPVEIDGKLLVDGMLTDNLPIDVAHTMGADVIIAVNVGTPLMKREQLGSIVGVAGQMISILTEQNVQNSLALLTPNDILITPELGDFQTSDFDHLKDTLMIGENAARKMESQLLKLSLSPQEYASYRKAIPPLLANSSHVIDQIEYKDFNHVNPRYVESLIDSKAGEMMNQEILDHDLQILYGTGDFEHVHYKLNKDKDDHYLLSIDAKEKSWGPNYLRFGMGLDSDFHGNAEFNLIGRIRKTWLNSLGAESITDIQIGHTNRISSEFYQPLNGRQNYFVAPMIEVKQSPIDLYAGNQNIARYIIERYRAGIDIGASLNTYGELRAGIRKGIGKASLEIGPESMIPKDNTLNEGSFIASLLLDKFDSVTFPMDGWMLKTNLYNANTVLNADDTYTKWDAQGSFVHSFGRHTFNLFAAGAGSLEGELPYYDQHKWGGFLRQSGYQNGQFLCESFSFGRLMYYNKLIEYPALKGVYAGLSFEVGKINDPLVNETSTDLLISGAGFLGAKTPFGPLYFGYGQAQDGSNSFYLFLGLPY